VTRYLAITLLLFLSATACQHQQPTKAIPAKTAASANDIFAKKPTYDAELLFVAKTGDYAGAQQALRRGASPNARGFYHMSPLLWAVSRHDLRMATLLLDQGADPNQPKKDGVTPVFLATVFPPREATDLTLATLLVERGADVSRPGKEGQTALEWVAFYGHVPIAEFLVQHGADVNAVDRFGQTPLSMAKGQHHDEMIAFLTSHGAANR
jgi:ankyrin repeat protein